MSRTPEDDRSFAGTATPADDVRPDERLASIAAGLERASPEDVLRWAAGRFAPRLAFATGFGPEGLVLLDLIARHRLPVDVFTLDTGLFFPETYALWRRLEARYALSIRAVRPMESLEEQAARHGRALWERRPDLCCAIRKVEPLAAALLPHEAWISGIRRDQTADRGTARTVEWDARYGLVKVNPLLAWTGAEVWSYLRAHDVPTNPLHERGYPSIGCRPCTSPVLPGEDPRAGRWRGRAKTECGLHARPDLPGPVAPSADCRGASEARPALFPVFLKLAGRAVLVVGGGPVAEGKVAALLAAGAHVTVVAPEVREGVEVAGVRVLRRPFQADDVAGQWLVLAAAPPEVNRQVSAAAEGRGIFVNAVDDPAHGTAYTAGVLRRDGVTIAVSTGGRAPALAGLLREALEAVLPEDLADWVAVAARLREAQKSAGVPMRSRRPQLLEALNRLRAAPAGDPDPQ